MAVQFEDNSIHVKAALNDTMIGFLYEAAGELEAATKRNTKGGDSGLKDSWTYHVDESKGEAQVGNPMELAIWYELGTGDYAVNNDGRKGGWWIKVGNGKGCIPLKDAKKYGWKKVRKDKDGNLTFVFTTGMKPRRPLQTAFNNLKNAIIAEAQRRFTEGMR